MSTWWQQRTLRFRLALWYSLGGAVLLTAFSATLYLFVAQRMAQPLAKNLQEDLQTIRRHLTIDADLVVRWDGDVIRTDEPWDAQDPWFELWDEQGRLVRRLWPFTEKRLRRLPAAPVPRSETVSVFRIAQDIRLRSLSAPFPVQGRPWMIRVMQIHEPAGEALGSLLAIILVALPLVVGLLVAGGYFITRRWLRPLELMVRQAEGISIRNLGQRLPEGNDAELGRLAAAFNSTLNRLEDSFKTLDRFVADASHELRTPLTTLRSVGEVGLRRSRTLEEYQEIIGSMLEEAQRLQQLVERLLELASAEGGVRHLHCESLPLDRFVRNCVSDLGILAEINNQQIVTTTTACTARADPVLLRQILQNLVDNATKYSPQGSTIRITVGAAAGECRISVADEGPGIPPEHARHLADRFYRVDDSRVREKGGFGLGLAITKAYLRVMGGQLEYVPVVPNGSCFSVILPDAGPP
jgi:heavy metal sensor kinase